MRLRLFRCCTCLLASLAGPALAGPQPDELYRLSAELTPVGAERTGNTAGTIPAWTGGLKQPPSAYRPGQVHLDPFAEESPEFVIDGQNYSAHADQLAPGQVAMLEAGRDRETFAI